GVIQPLREVMRLAQNKGAWLHVDAAQGWGKVSVDLDGVSSASVAPHKFRGPKGIGALVTAPHVRLTPLLVGGSQEKGNRPGTVDPALAA
ncbi:aminotransferase class V-fold PLP-dependent enzyme, partial [Bacillus atrophaeus]|uniref:aminotransferase class V-fold PLP-dependent enzyme n=1 Tax=Bacillus atrophaeus TaxID=1452 RepID=UPI001EFB39F2